MELGPLFVKQSPNSPLTIVTNNHSWVKDYNILFVDQPVGTGLSYADPTFKDVYCKSMEEVATDFYFALQELYLKPQGCFNRLGVKPNHPLFIFG
jgi:vitellogenic carboxypeptidase-like protein